MSVTRKLKSINNTYATVQRSLRNSYFYLARMNQKVTVKTFIALQNIPILNKLCSFELSINQSILKKK